MAETSSALRQQLIQLSEPVRELLSKTTYKPSESGDVCIKSELLSLIPSKSSIADIRAEVRDFALCCALLSSSSLATFSSSSSPLISWIPAQLAIVANDAFIALAANVYGGSGWEQSAKVEEFGLELDLAAKEDERLVIELMPDLLPLIKDTIKNSSVDGDDDGDEVSAASARTPVAYALVAARQFRWFVTKVNRPNLGKLCGLMIPSALTALDHWSPAVKEQGMFTFIYLAKNVNSSDFGCYGDVVLDACCHNIVSNDEIWHIAVEMSVLLLTSTQRGNPRSPWLERMLTEMIGHLERQPRSKERRIPWLQLIEPMLCTVGLILLGHFRRLIPLLFQWMHADDDETLILVLKRIHTIVKVTWIRKTPYVQRLVDELSLVYRESATRIAREEIRSLIQQILMLLQQCKGMQFEKAWEKHKDCENMRALCESINR